MLFTILFPISDSRIFLEQESGMLSRPYWPAAAPDVDFVRNFGMVRSEGEILCEAHQALRFRNTTMYRDSQTRLRIPFSIAYRQFSSDGFAVRKIEVGIATEKNWRCNLSTRQTEDLIFHLLHLKVAIPSPLGNSPAVCCLWEANRHLAPLYALSSTSYNHTTRFGEVFARLLRLLRIKNFLGRYTTRYVDKIEDWWVRPCKPLVLLIHAHNEKLNVSLPPGLVRLRGKKGIRLSYHSVPVSQFDESGRKVGGDRIGMWVMRLRPRQKFSDLDIDSLRQTLRRLHTEPVCFLQILPHIADKFTFTQGSAQAKRLEKYLNHVERVVSEKEDKTGAEVAEFAREDILKPNERAAVLAGLRRISIDLKKFGINLAGHNKAFVDDITLQIEKKARKQEANIYKKVFISYNHDDREIAKKLEDALRIRDIEITIDQAMKPGQDIRDFILKSIRKTDVTLSLVSNKSLLSAWVALESIYTFYHERFDDDKLFIACYIDDDFFESGFQARATDQINKQITDVETAIDDLRKRNQDSVALDDKKTRLYDLRHNLGKILKRLNNSLTLDIRDEKFDESVERIIDAIMVQWDA